VPTFMYPRDLLGPLRTIWPEWRRHEGEAPPLPDDEFLGVLLETMYHASFTSDEQRGTRLVAVVCDPQEADDPIRFASPREFTAHELMRLSPIASVDGTSLGIAPARVGSPPQVWGLCSGAFMKLTVSIDGPGAVDIGRNNLPLLSLRAGSIGSGPKATAFDAVSRFLRRRNDELWQGISFTASWSPQQTLFPGYLLGIGSNIARQGHGGAILAVPDSDADNLLERDWISVKYRCSDDSIWDVLCRYVRRFDDAFTGENAGGTYPQSPEVTLNRKLSRVARLAAVDGAVLVTDRLRVLGFGAEVTVRSSVPRSFGRMVSRSRSTPLGRGTGQHFDFARSTQRASRSSAPKTAASDA
jgi:hypothetical protein